MRWCIQIPMVSLDSMKKWFFNNFGKSLVLILYQQLWFLQSGWFPGKMNWTGTQLHLASLSSVLEVWNLSQNFSTHRHSVFSWNIEMLSKSSFRGCDGFCFEVCLNAVRLLRPSPIQLCHWRAEPCILCIVYSYWKLFWQISCRWDTLLRGVPNSF